ncbi:MAG: glycosyltransferase, partial [Planctomycetota bacterium]
EGFPNTFIQACKAATAILSFQVNPDNFLNRHNCGIACGGETSKTADQLKQLLADDRYAEYGDNGRNYVRAHHNIQSVIETYKDHFRKILPSKQP